MKNHFLISGFPFLLFIIFTYTACLEREYADVIYHNANIYTINPHHPSAEAIAVKGQRILAIGTDQEVLAFQNDETKLVDLSKAFMMPGLIEGHAHFSGLGESLMNLNFLDSKNWDEIVGMVSEKVAETPKGEWIIGRGWHQEKWDESPKPQVLGYPYHDALSEISSNNPVMLSHASGHSLFANQAAMNIVGINNDTPNPSGGEIVRDASGKAIGVFEETAMDLFQEAYDNYLKTLTPEEKAKNWQRKIQLAEEECLKNGITSFQDAGATFDELAKYESMAKNGLLNIRLWSMIGAAEDSLVEKASDYPKIGIGNNYFTCRAIKAYADGALGAFGAWMLQPYDDKPNAHGQNVTPLPRLKAVANHAFQNDLQMCIHAIGDRANRVVLNIFEENFNTDTSKNNLRWRVEHAQHINPKDIPRFRELGVIASMQGIHCTSDAPFVEKRLGTERARTGAYPWRSLLDAGVIIANGTDAPVENIDPFACLYASVTRRRTDSGLEFFPEQSMTRAEALNSYTLGNAFAAFEEKEKGTLEIGKLADMVVLSNDLTTCEEEKILSTEVLMTIVGGEIKYNKSEN